MRIALLRSALVRSAAARFGARKVNRLLVVVFAVAASKNGDGRLHGQATADIAPAGRPAMTARAAT